MPKSGPKAPKHTFRCTECGSTHPTWAGKVSRLRHVGCSGTCRGRRGPRQCSLVHASGRAAVWLRRCRCPPLKPRKWLDSRPVLASSTVCWAAAWSLGRSVCLGGSRDRKKHVAAASGRRHGQIITPGAVCQQRRVCVSGSPAGRTSGGRLGWAGQSFALGGDLLGPHFGTSSPAPAGCLGLGLHSVGAPRRRGCRAGDPKPDSPLRLRVGSFCQGHRYRHRDGGACHQGRPTGGPQGAGAHC